MHGDSSGKGYQTLVRHLVILVVRFTLRMYSYIGGNISCLMYLCIHGVKNVKEDNLI
jgi:hypothetical protein